MMKLTTRNKIGKALSLGAGISLGAFSALMTGAACKYVAKGHPLLAAGLFLVANTGSVLFLTSTAVDPIVEDIHNWVYKEEREKRELEATKALLSLYESK